MSRGFCGKTRLERRSVAGDRRRNSSLAKLATFPPQRNSMPRSSSCCRSPRMTFCSRPGSTREKALAKACEELGVPIRVLYMSNAEEYFKYTPDFRANVASLPIDDANAVVLRTIYSKKWVHADLWAYQVQPLVDFRARLEDKKNRSRNPMLRLAEYAKELDREPGPKGLSLVALSSRE